MERRAVRSRRIPRLALVAVDAPRARDTALVSFGMAHSPLYVIASNLYT